MVPVTSLFLAILLSAVAVFLASSVVHMLLPYHKGDFRRVSGEVFLPCHALVLTVLWPE